MSALLSKEKRARARQNRRQRREQILLAATHLFVRQPWSVVTLDYIGRRVGVANGIASLHFATKEELFLEVLRQELTAWFDFAEDRLKRSPEPVGGKELADLLADDLAGRPELTRLVALLHNVLEQNIEVLPAQLFTDWLRRRTLELAALLEHRCVGFGAGDGAAFLRRLGIVVIGLRQTAAPSGIFSVLLQDEELDPFRVGLREELHSPLTRILPDASVK